MRIIDQLPFFLILFCLIVIIVCRIYNCRKSRTGLPLYTSRIDKKTLIFFMITVVLWSLILFSGIMLPVSSNTWVLNLNIIGLGIVFCPYVIGKYKITKLGVCTPVHFYFWDEILQWNWEGNEIFFKTGKTSFSWTVQEEDKSKVDALVTELLPKNLH